MANHVEWGSGFVQGNGVKLHYIELGTGTKPMLAFHGYGQSAAEFKALEASLGSEYKIYSFSLFFHGRSIYSLRRVEKTTLRKHELREIFLKFLTEHQIESFSLAGYSIGGKLALNLAELFPENIENIFLFSPDGLKPNPWVRFVTFNNWGRYLYKKFVASPLIIHSLLKILSGLKLLDKKVSEFILYNTSTEEQRLRVYRTWMSFRHLEPDLDLFQELYSGRPLNFHLFFGRYDRIISPAVGRKFVKKSKVDAGLHIIFTGHRLLSEKTQKYLLKNPGIWKS